MTRCCISYNEEGVPLFILHYVKMLSKHLKGIIMSAMIISSSIANDENIILT